MYSNVLFSQIVAIDSGFSILITKFDAIETNDNRLTINLNYTIRNHDSLNKFYARSESQLLIGKNINDTIFDNFVKNGIYNRSVVGSRGILFDSVIIIKPYDSLSIDNYLLLNYYASQKTFEISFIDYLSYKEMMARKFISPDPNVSKITFKIRKRKSKFTISGNIIKQGHK